MIAFVLLSLRSQFLKLSVVCYQSRFLCHISNSVNGTTVNVSK